jgi:hypothetical protein
MGESRIYHVGVVVAELEPAMRELSATTGITWARRQDAAVSYDTPVGSRTWEASFVCSTEPPHIELLEHRADSVWAELGFHHLGLWSADVHADSLALETQGCVRQAAMTDADGVRTGGCYHLLTAAASRVEVVSENLSRPRLERYLGGGSYL